MLSEKGSTHQFGPFAIRLIILFLLFNTNGVRAFLLFPLPQKPLSKGITNEFGIMKNLLLLSVGNKLSLSPVAHIGKPNKIHAASNADNEETEDDNDNLEFGEKSDTKEQTILRVSLLVVDPQLKEDALAETIAFVQSFPFAAVLPVQPLTYVPSDDASGVKVSFLRKKTKEKGSIDGGVDISVRLKESKDEGDDDLYKIEIEAKRNSEGQTISKSFSEMLIVKALMRGISGEDTERSNKDLLELVSIDSFFHQWME